MTSVYCFVSHILAGGTTEQFTWNTLSSVPQLLMDGSNAYIYGPQGTALGTAPVEQISLSAPNSQSSVTYLVSDPEGVRLTFNSSGTITAGATYSAYGQVIAGGLSSITPFGYAGGYTDPTGLIYLINRYYDPSTGQFLSVDPLVGITDQPYQYAGGDPINGSDPLGLAWCSFSPVGCGIITEAQNSAWNPVSHNSYFRRGWESMSGKQQLADALLPITLPLAGLAAVTSVGAAAGVGVLGASASTTASLALGSGVASTTIDLAECIGLNSKAACVGSAIGFLGLGGSLLAGYLGADTLAGEIASILDSSVSLSATEWDALNTILTFLHSNTICS